MLRFKKYSLVGQQTGCSLRTCWMDIRLQLKEKWKKVSLDNNSKSLTLKRTFSKLNQTQISIRKGNKTHGVERVRF